MRFPKILQFVLSFALLLLAGLFFTETQGLTHLGFLDVSTLAGSGYSFATCVSVASISEECGPNIGGTTKLYVIAKEDVDLDAFPPVVGVSISQPIVPKEGKGFALLEFAEDTGEINFKSSGDQGNQAFDFDLGVYIPRMTPAIAAIVNGMLNRKYLVIKEDGNGQKMLAGDEKRFMTFNIDYKSGKKYNEKNGGDYRFTGGFGHVPYFYNAAVPVIGAPVV